VILTGTPSGVGPVVPGDKVECQLARNSPSGEELLSLKFEATQREGGYRFQED
jgi:acylpyruvate hydrolase